MSARYSALVKLSLVPQPAPAWTAIVALLIVTGVGIFLFPGSILRLAFPLGALAVGAFLYKHYSILYLGFTLWIWFLTPLLSRIIDYRNGWDASRVILVTPYLVTLLTIATLFRYLPNINAQERLPLILAFIGVLYGFLVGLINSSWISVARTLLDWLMPITFAFHLLVNWQNYPYYRQNFQRTFLGGVLVTGIYGVVQYLIAPEWDRNWLIQSGMNSVGNPEPFEMRIWSTMNSPGIFANMMVAGLILLFTQKSALRIPAAIAGSLSFLLSLVRSSWGSWFLALLLFIPSLKQKLQIRIIITLLLLTLCAFPVTKLEFFAERINSRLQTISNLEEDNSFNARKALYARDLKTALVSVQGKGIGSTFFLDASGNWQKFQIDSGIINLFFTLGWLGASCYLGGLILAIFNVIRYAETSNDLFMSATRALGLSYCTQMIFGTAVIGLTGLFLWGFLSITMAAHKYYQHQHH